MKLKWILLAMTMFFIAPGCEKDTFYSNDSEMNLKSGHMKTVPLKGDICAVTTVFDNEGHYAGYTEGDLSHLGKIDSQKSTYVRDGEPSQVGMVLHGNFIGKIVAANGDELNYYLMAEINIIDGSYIGEVFYDGGTGRFKNASGNASFIGQSTEDGIRIYMKGEGYLSNIGHSKK